MKAIVAQVRQAQTPPKILAVSHDGELDGLGIETHKRDLWESPRWLSQCVTEILGDRWVLREFSHASLPLSQERLNGDSTFAAKRHSTELSPKVAISYFLVTGGRQVLHRSCPRQTYPIADNQRRGK